jgi:ATP-dependent helicase/nuclease subunit A
MNDMPQLTVYKASAGSGKTWRLTVEYLKLLLLNPESYRSILAVTFTNKATAEMKERVLNSLYELMHIDPAAKPEGMLAAVCDELTMTPAKAKSQARLAMSFLLHDYGRFRIETIDSFFQSVLRNLARELGLGSFLNIELNNASVLSDAVDAMVDKATADPELLNWMTDYMEEMVQEGKSWKIERVLKDFGQTIFKEYFQEKEKELEKKLNDKNFLRNFKKLLKERGNIARKEMEKPADDYFQILSTNGLSVEDFSYGKTGASSFFIKLKRGEYDPSIFQGSRLTACLEAPEKWTSAKHPRRKEIAALATSTLIPLLLRAEKIRTENYRDLVSAQLASAHLNKIGLLTDIAAEVRELNRESNRFLLSDTNALLKSLLDGADASFVYEKTGTELNHILFDEFQDTSRMQWDTFKPLLNEGLANGYDSLIVGDEKQSLYRWRNGDWRILGNIAQEMKPAIVQEKVLKNNWRSERNIIDFNNALFQQMERSVNRMHLAQFETESPELTKAYSDVAQQSEKKETAGLVDITFISADNNEIYEPIVLERLVQQVEDLQRKGIRPDQIAILIRVNKEIPMIGKYFADHKASDKHDPSLCYDIVSDDAFLLESSKAVQIIIDALRLLNDPANLISQTLLKLDYQTDVQGFSGDLSDIFKYTPKPVGNALSAKTAYKKTFLDAHPEAALLPPEFISRFDALQRMPLYELAEELYRLFRLDRIPAQDSYLYCFMDKLSEYLLHAPSDITSFLTHWDEQMAKTSIPAGSSVNGIRILSIHKSKGLEFHTVLVPFCDWKLLNARTFQVWCKPEKAPYDQLALLPVNYTSAMADSCFQKDYAEETLQLWVDALNLLYVAFTRARHNLYVFCRGNENIKNYKGPATIANLLQDTVKNGGEAFPEKMREGYLGGTSKEESLNDSEKQNPDTTLISTFRYGKQNFGNTEALPELTHQPSDPSGKHSNIGETTLGNDTPEATLNSSSKANVLQQKGRDISLPFSSFAHKTRFRQSNRSLEFSSGRSPNGFTNSYIDRGKLLHRLFSDIQRREDLPAALMTLQSEGLMTSSEAAEYSLFAEKALANPAVSDWYSGKHRLFNECSILCPDPDGKLQLKRPDRVMLSPDSVQVVDFKFGKPSGKYRKQVQEYMDLLRKMGYPGVKGYLWYVDEERVEEIN